MNIIWLCSWYPNSEDNFTGDFIQRQALAVSAFAKIEIVHVVFCAKTATSINKVNENLVENIFYQKKKNFLSNLFHYYTIHKNFFKKYQERNGKADLVHVQIPFKAGLIALWLKYFRQIPFVLTEHYGIYNSFLEDDYQSRSWFFKLITKLVVKHSSKLTTVSTSLGEDMNALVTKKEYEVVSNVVDTSLFNFSIPPISGKFQFVHISNMIPLKNIKGIIEAVGMLWQVRQDFTLTFIGNIVEEYYHLVKEKKLLDTAIFFKGILPYTHIAGEIKNSNALIIFSDTESQSCVVLESLCCGRPAIVTNVGGVKELIHTGNGYLVNVQDSRDLMQKMNQMMDNYDWFEQERISKEAIEKYSYNAVGKQFYAVYQSVLH